jgi:hypothetical protein
MTNTSPNRPACGGLRLRPEVAAGPAFVGCIVLTLILIAAGATRSPAAATGVYAVYVAGVTWVSAASVGLAAGPVAWLFLDGFLVGRGAQLHWDGQPDGERLALLVATALLVLGARATYSMVRSIVRSRGG